MFKEAISFIRKWRGKRVAITFHTLADVDCVGSAFALKSALPDADIIAPDKPASMARRLMEQLALRFDWPAKHYDAVIVVDTNSRALLPHYSKLIKGKAVLVIDHHSLHTDRLKGATEWIDQSYISTSEMVMDLIKALKVKIDPKIATMLFYGVIADSACFRTADVRLFRHAAELLERSHQRYHKLLADLPGGEESISERLVCLRAAQRVQSVRVDDLLIAWAPCEGFEAAVALSLIGLGADVAFAGYRHKHGARISARERPALEGTLDLAALMRWAGAQLGGSGGGHRAAAGAVGPRKAMLEAVLKGCAERAAKKLKS